MITVVHIPFEILVLELNYITLSYLYTCYSLLLPSFTHSIFSFFLSRCILLNIWFHPYFCSVIISFFTVE